MGFLDNDMTYFGGIHFLQEQALLEHNQNHNW